MLSVLSHLWQDLNFELKFQSFTYSSAVIDRELYIYRTQTGTFWDTYDWDGDQNKKGEDKVSMDSESKFESTCCEALSSSLIKVSSCLNGLGIIAPEIKDGAVNKSKWRFSSILHNFVVFILSILRICCYRSQNPFHDENENYEDARISIDKYVQKRLNKRARELHMKAAGLTFWLQFYKSFIYIVSASSSVLALLGFEAILTPKISVLYFLL